jgi:hypothetical protein
MALKIEVEGYVNEVKTFGWGTVLKMTHSQRAKNKESGQWETVGKDYLDVVLPEGFNVDLIREGMILNVLGSFKVETYAKRDGTTGIALKVRATDIEQVERQGAKSFDAAATLTAAGAESLDMPF